MQLTKFKFVFNVCVVTGTLSITSNELYFEVDEIDSVNKDLDPNVRKFLFIQEFINLNS